MSAFLNKIAGDLDLTASAMLSIRRDFHREMALGLEGKPGSLKMIPAYIDIPTGGEKGRYLAIDLGGTNFRVAYMELKGGSAIGAVREEKFRIDKKHMTGPGRELFDFIAGKIRAFLIREKLLSKGEMALGFTFSFPVRQTSVASGVLIRWTKGFSAGGVEGKDVVRLLSSALERSGLTDISVAALVNDTVGTLVASAYTKRGCDAGVIIGTGTNACYRESVRNITKLAPGGDHGKNMIVNIEWGNFDKLKATRFDRALDASSSNPNSQMLEKMVSGIYLGEIARLIISEAARSKAVFSGKPEKFFSAPYGLTTEHLSVIESDRTGQLLHTEKLFDSLKIKTTYTDRAAILGIARIVTRRAARISAAAIASVVTKGDKTLLRDHVVAIDGSVFEKHPTFAKNMRIALKDMLGARHNRIKIVLAKDGSGKGAAIIAAVAANKGR